MAATRLFERQAALYATYHRDRRNRATHCIGIPAIVLSLLVFAAAWRIPVAGIELSAAWVVAALAGLGWVALDLRVGMAMVAALVPMTLFASWMADRFGHVGSWTAAGALFVGGWAFQLVGHVFEGRRPALFDNLFQAFIGPMFVMAEFLALLGLKPKRSTATPAA